MPVSFIVIDQKKRSRCLLMQPDCSALSKPVDIYHSVGVLLAVFLYVHVLIGDVLLYAFRFALGLFIAPMLQAFIETNNVYVLEQLGLVFRNSLMGAIYRKTLKLNAEALNTASTGKIVTLMSNDAQKLQVCTLSRC